MEVHLNFQIIKILRALRRAYERLEYSINLFDTS